MQRFIGLDVHGQSCTMVVMGPTQSEWLYEVLEPHVKRIVVTQPLQRAGSKNDAIDAWALADLLRRDAVERTVFKAPKTMTMLRQAARGYIAVRRDLVRGKCRLNALYRSRGLQPHTEIYDAERRKTWLQKLPPRHRPLGHEGIFAELGDRRRADFAGTSRSKCDRPAGESRRGGKAFERAGVSERVEFAVEFGEVEANRVEILAKQGGELGDSQLVRYLDANGPRT